ncbi:MAG: DUF177 domain-containing protein [Acidobacteriota bacterium]
MKERIFFDDVDRYGPQTASLVLPLPTEEVNRDEMARMDEVAITATVAPGDLPQEYLATGEVSYTADLRCGRCLDPYPFASRTAFSLRYRPRPAGQSAGDEEFEISQQELDVEYYSERSVSLREIAAEQVQLSIPMKPLCDAKCPGLCPACGVNLNKDGCSCSAGESDSRWAALEDIRDQLAKKKQS